MKTVSSAAARWQARAASCLVAAIAAAFLAMAGVVAAETDGGWIPLSSKQGHLIIEVEVDGEPARVLLDTGTTRSAMSTRFAERAGVRPDRMTRARVTGVFGERTVHLSQQFTMNLAGDEVPLSGLLMMPGLGVDMIFGQAFFELLTVQIDYPNHRIRFLPSGAVDFDPNVDFRWSRKDRPLVKTRVNGRKTWMLLDTGNGGFCILTRDTVRGRDLDEYRIEAAKLSGHGIHTGGDMNLLQLDSLELGPYGFSDFLATYADRRNDGIDGRRQRSMSRIRSAKTHYDGILGYEIMRNFLVTMDLGEERVHFGLPPERN